MKLVYFPCLLLGLACLPSRAADDAPRAPAYAYEDRDMRGWKAHVRAELLTPERKATTEKALQLVDKQLADVERLVPAKALAELKKVPLWFSPPYPGKDAGAAYHPGAPWLRDNGRDPAMAKGVEFSNIDKLDKEVLRMPLLTLHELSHAYHDRVLGFRQPDIKACYDRAVANGSYDHVSRRDWQGKVTKNVRAYAMTNEREYFAETTEAYFGINDFFPYDRAELEQHDPEMLKVIRKVWGIEGPYVPAKPTHAYVERDLRGWKAHVREELLAPDKKESTERAIALVAKQLEEMEKLLPPKAVAQLRTVPICFSLPHPDMTACAAFYPGIEWVRRDGRDLILAKSIEFSRLDQLDKEVQRMPLLTLHEFTHAYHHLVLGADQPDIDAAYRRAKAGGTYDHVSRRDWQGKVTENVEAYAMKNRDEFFAETSEAYFGTNDFFPYNRAELEQHDPETVKVLKKVWGVE